MTGAPGRRAPGGFARQRGAALLIALLAVALAVLLATELVERSQRDVARTTAVVDAERAWQFAEGVEGLARDWIRRQRQLPTPCLRRSWRKPNDTSCDRQVRAHLDNTRARNVRGEFGTRK